MTRKGWRPGGIQSSEKAGNPVYIVELRQKPAISYEVIYKRFHLKYT
jgi:hypothetical protein